MTTIEVEGKRRLKGELTIQGSKNAVLPLMAASVLCKGTTVLHGCPRIRDVFCMKKLLEEVGCKVSFERGHTMLIDASSVQKTDLDREEVNEVRASILLVGAMLGRCNQVTIRYPGGCSIGKRPIDFHLWALRKMEAEITENEDTIQCSVGHLKGKKISLEFPSVGATENILLAAVLAEGITWIRNAAREPEIVELCQVLRAMGARIEGEGTEHILIQGVKKLFPITHTVGYDRIVLLTYGVLVAGTGGNVTLRTGERAIPGDLEILLKLGCRLQTKEGYVKIRQSDQAKSIYYVRTRPYPGVPTDIQSALMAVLSCAKGNSILEEAVFESRLKTAQSLCKMGADIEVVGNRAYIAGTKTLHGATVRAEDLRGGAALCIAGLLAEGKTQIENAELIWRGYENFIDELQQLGGTVRCHQ